MGLKCCEECGKLYLENPSGICVDCQKAENLLVERVTEYLREAKRATIEEVHKATGVKYKTILRLLRTGRITTEDDFSIYFNCANCGKPIPEGNYCDDCARKLSAELHEKAREMTQQQQPTVDQRTRSGQRMYTWDTEKK